MSTDERERVSAWAAEQPRRARAAARGAPDDEERARGRDGGSVGADRDLLLYCHGFCVALDGHHRAEDRALFPAIEAAHPDLAPTLRALEQDHSMIAHLLGELRAASTAERTRPFCAATSTGSRRSWSHFRYEEKALLTVLETLALDGSREEVLGPL